MHNISDFLGQNLLMMLLGLVSVASFLSLLVSIIGGRDKVLKRRVERVALSSGAHWTDKGTGRSGLKELQGVSTSEVARRIDPSSRWQRVIEYAKISLVRKYSLLAAIAIFSASVVLIFTGVRPLSALVIATALTLVAAWFMILRAKQRRLDMIEAAFPGALDLMVRSLNAGLTISDAFRIISNEFEPRIAHEFRLLEGELSIGIPLAQAIRRLSERVPLQDVQLFAIVISIQGRSGGSLVGALQNVADTVRARSSLRQKIVIMSSEARASALIIGSIPIILSCALFYFSPEFIGKMFSTTTGNIVLAITVLWMLAGIQVMRSMIRFDA